VDAIERSAKENVLIPPTAAAGLGPWSEVICAETIQWYSGKRMTRQPSNSNRRDRLVRLLSSNG